MLESGNYSDVRPARLPQRLEGLRALTKPGVRGFPEVDAAQALLAATETQRDEMADLADDRWQVWFGLHRLGMPVAQIDRARRLAVMRPLRVLLVIVVGATVIVLSPMIGAGALISPMTLAAVVVVLPCAGLSPRRGASRARSLPALALARSSAPIGWPPGTCATT